MPQDAARQRLIRLIHVAKRDLALDDDTYRDILQAVGKKASSADLSVPELETVLEHLKRSGFKIRSKPKTSQAIPSRPLAQDAESQKIRALWLFLHQLGAVKNPSEAALGAYTKRVIGVDALQWLTQPQAARLIESLKKWAMRFLPGAVKSLAQQAGTVPMSAYERARIEDLLGKASRGTFDPMKAVWDALQATVGNENERV